MDYGYVGYADYEDELIEYKEQKWWESKLNKQKTKISELINKLKNRANNRSDEFIIINNEDHITLQTNDDCRYSIDIHVFQIPDSLEVKIVRKGVDVFNVRGKQRKRLLNNDPHDSLNEIAKNNNLTKEQLIEKSVFEDWFINDSWYQDLINKILSLNEFKTP